MTDDSRILDALRAIIEVVDKARSELPDEPCDPLDEVVSGYAPSTSPNHDAEADAWLEQSGKPRTLRNLLKAYMERKDADDVYSISLGGGWNRGAVRVMRVRRLTFNRPGHDSFYVDSTPLFPVPFGVPVSDLVGFTILGEHKVLDTYEANGNSYLIVQSFPDPLEDLLDS